MSWPRLTESRGLFRVAELVAASRHTRIIMLPHGSPESKKPWEIPQESLVQRGKSFSSCYASDPQGLTASSAPPTRASRWPLRSLISWTHNTFKTARNYGLCEYVNSMYLYLSLRVYICGNCRCGRAVLCASLQIAAESSRNCGGRKVNGGLQRQISQQPRIAIALYKNHGSLVATGKAKRATCSC